MCMWKFDEYGNATNMETGTEIYSVICPDGLIRVYKDSKILAVFHHLADAEKFIKNYVEESED